MPLNNATKVRLVSILFVITMAYIWFDLSSITYLAVQGVVHNSKRVVINVYSLWVPVGGLGALLSIIYVSPFLIYSGKPATELWGKKGQKVMAWTTGVFAILGVICAIATYQWLVSELDNHGYVYSEAESTLSAMGKHEVYIKP